VTHVEGPERCPRAGRTKRVRASSAGEELLNALLGKTEAFGRVAH
jgi:hypothetical protein